MGLPESIIAIFLLIAACLTMFLLYHSSMRHQIVIEQVNGATRLAQSKLAEIRAACRDLNQFRSGSWAGPPTPAAEPGFKIQVFEDFVTLHSPCSRIESAFGSNQRGMSSSYRKFTVWVSWNESRESVSATTLVGEPPAPGPYTVVVSGSTAPLAQGAKRPFQAALLDGSSRPIPDVMFNPSVLPSYGTSDRVGNGVIDITDPQTRRTGQTAMFWNNYPYPDAWRPVEGFVLVLAHCRYRGFTMRNWSSEFECKE